MKRVVIAGDSRLEQNIVACSFRKTRDDSLDRRGKLAVRVFGAVQGFAARFVATSPHAGLENVGEQSRLQQITDRPDKQW
jgi:hypothetical protein